VDWFNDDHDDDNSINFFDPVSMYISLKRDIREI